MSERAPWLRGRNGATVSFGATLNGGGGDVTPRQPWLASTAVVAEAPGCPGCRERDKMRAELAGLRAEAIEEGREEGMAETAMQRAVLSAAATAVNRARVTRDQSVTELIVDVALGLCVELAPAAASIDRRGLVDLLERALNEAGEKAGEHRDLTVRMCAEDVAAVRDQLPAGVTCETGADLAPGEVWVEAPRLVVDGRWAPRLAALREPLLALVRTAVDEDPSADDDGEGDHGA